MTGIDDSRGETADTSQRLWVGAAVALILLAGLLAYSNSFSGPFVLDDGPSINSNPSIRSLWPLSTVLSPPLQLSVSGRPITNLSLAINYALGGVEVAGYHIFNLIVHLSAALVLFGVVRRTLLTPVLRKQFGAESLPLALAVTLLWTVHPLQTESVTYVIQRNESISSLFYLLTLYCAIRGTDGERRLLWQAGSVVACFLGVGAKEVVVSAPVIVLIYDRTFLAGSFRDAIRSRWGYYLAMVASWLLLGYLIFSSDSRWGTAGVGTGVLWWEYGMTQLVAVTKYLGLVFWPSPLVFDYGYNLVREWRVALPYAPLIAGLLAATAAAVWKAPPIGFLGVVFVALLAPSSSIIPIKTQTMSEHRMYLPLAPVIAFVVVGGWMAAQRLMRDRKPFSRGTLPFYAAIAAITVALGATTFARNRDYGSLRSLWLDTVDKNPNNARAHYWVGRAYADIGAYPDAIRHYQTSIRLDPDSKIHHIALGNLYLDMVKYPEAIAQFRMAMKIDPEDPYNMANLATTLLRQGRANEAIPIFEKAIQESQGDPRMMHGLATAYAAAGNLAQGISILEALVKNSDSPLFVYSDLADMLDATGRKNEAAEAYRHVLSVAQQLGDAQLTNHARMKLSGMR